MLQEESLGQAARNYEKARRIAETRYEEGAVPLTEVLLTRRQELQARTGLIRVRGERLAQRVNLHLALGGNFEAGTIDLQPKPTP
jgi:outer membrane protein TolC